MRKFKFLIFIFIAALLSCYKIPSEAPEWEVRINIPIGDSLVTAQQIVDDTTIKSKMTIEVDSFYNDTLWTVFHHSDTSNYGGQSFPDSTIFRMTVKHKVSDNIDTTKSHFHSLAKKMLTRIYNIDGYCDTAFSGTVVCSIVPPDTFQHFVPFIVNFPLHISTGTLVMDTTFVIDSFPLGPYRNHITLYQDSGSIRIDNADAYAKLPINFLSRGDTIVTFLKAVSVHEELATNKDKKYIKSVIAHLVVTNRTAAGFTGNFRIGTEDSSVVWTSRPITIEQAPTDESGFTIGDSMVTVIDDTITSEYVSMTDEDSLYWKADLTVPEFGEIFLRPEDWLRIYGYVSIELWIDPDSLGGEE